MYCSPRCRDGDRCHIPYLSSPPHTLQVMYCSPRCRDGDRCHVASGPECGVPWPRLVREEALLACRLAAIESDDDDDAVLRERPGEVTERGAYGDVNQTAMSEDICLPCKGLPCKIESSVFFLPMPSDRCLFSLLSSATRMRSRMQIC